MTGIRRLITAELRQQRGRLAVAGLSASIVAAGSVLLLGLSGWFITGAALAGLGGAALASAFNVLLPSAGIRLLAILRTGGRYSERLSAHDAAFRALARIRPALYRGIAASPPSHAMALSSGEAVARAVQDVDEVEARFVRRSAGWGAAASAAAGAGLLLLAGPWAALAGLGVLAALIAGTYGLARMLEPLGRAVPHANGRLKDEFATLAAAGPELCAYGLEAWAADRIGNQSAQLVQAQSRVTVASGWFELMLATGIGTAAMLALALADGSMPIAAAAALGTTMMIDGVAPFLRGIQRRGQLQAAETRLDAMLIVPTVGTWLPSPPDPPMIELPGLGIRLVPGMIAGLVGPSGCGKTTLIEQLLGLRDVPRGRIRLSGVDLNDLDPAWVRGCFAHAPQDSALLAGTIRSNLLLADPDASDAALWDALHDAAIDGTVRALPGGLESWIGENGARLSGGERRRISLARALLRPASWILLDEPTAGLDPATETLVIERLHSRLTRLQQGAVIISHRALPLGCCGIITSLAPDADAAAETRRAEIMR